MAENIPIRDIPGDVGEPTASSLVAMDDGVNMKRTTAQALVLAGRPAASQSEAETGSENTKVMTPLRVAQAITVQGAAQFATTDQLDVIAATTEGYRDAALAAQVAAEEARDDAESARDDAQDAEDVATSMAGTATGAASTASTSAGQALTYRNAAETFADLSEAWAEGTEPGGPGTKSSQEWAAEAAASAANVNLPSIEPGDAGKVLAVNEEEDGYVLTEGGSGNNNWTVDTFTGDGTTDPLVLSAEPGSMNNVFVIIEGLGPQPASAFTLDGDELTPSEAWPGGAGIEVRYGSSIEVGTPADGSVTESKLGTGAVTRIKVANDAIGADQIDATEAEAIKTKLGISAGGGSAARNLIINGDGRLNQRGVTAPTDDTYAHDRHYALTQTAAIGVSTLANPADGIASMFRLTQSQATAQRMGYATILEASDTYPLRGQEITLGGKLRYSNAAAVRFAVLEWTGTADTVTSDVVNSWTNGTFTAGQFFNSTTLTVTAVGTLTPSAATITDFELVTTVGSSANNLILFIWTEGTAPQSSTLDFRWFLALGDADGADLFGPRPMAEEIALAQRYYCKTYELGTAPGTTFAPGAHYFVRYGGSKELAFLQRMRVPPSVTIYNPATGGTGTWRDTDTDGNITITVDNIATRTARAVVGGTNGNNMTGHWTASAEL